MYHKVQAGDPLQFPASLYNAMIEVVETYLKRNVKLGAVKGDNPKNVVNVQNTTSKAWDQYAVVGIDGPAFEPEDSEFSFGTDSVLKGSAPNDERHNGRFAVMQEPVGPDEIGRAVVIGVTPVKLKLTEGDDDPAIAVPVDGETGFLEGGSSGGASVLWVEDSKEEKRWALILLGGTASEGGEGNAIVIETIKRPSDPEAEVPDGRGKIRIVGKRYIKNEKSGEYDYDECACLELVGDEVLPPGSVVKIRGPYKGNENDDKDDEKSKNVQWYSAYGTPGVYQVRLESDLEYKGTASIKLPTFGGDENEYVCEVHDVALREDELYEKGTPVFVKRQGDQLIVYDGPCVLGGNP